MSLKHKRDHKKAISAQPLPSEKKTQRRRLRKSFRYIKYVVIILFFVALSYILFKYVYNHKYDQLVAGVHEDLVNEVDPKKWIAGKKYDDIFQNYSVEGNLVRFDMKNNWVIVKTSNSIWKVNTNEETKYYSNNFSKDENGQETVSTTLYRTQLAFYHHLNRKQWIRIDCQNVVCTDAVGVINYIRD